MNVVTKLIRKLFYSFKILRNVLDLSTLELVYFTLVQLLLPYKMCV